MKDIGEAFKFVFKDPHWLVKVFIGGMFTLLSIVAIGAPIVYGYCIEVLQRVQRGEEYPLPEWTDIGVKFVAGFKFLIALLVYYLPMLVVLIPVVIVFCIAALQGADPNALMESGAFSVVMFLFVVPYSLIVTLITPFIAIEFAESERIRDGVDIGSVLMHFKRHWEDAVLVAIITIGLGFAASVGIMFFLVGILFTSFYVSIVRFHLFGQMGRTIHEMSVHE